MVVVVAIFAAFYIVERKNNAASKSPAPAAVLDGTYRLTLYLQKQTREGAPDPIANKNNIVWWAFRSSCTSTGCVATGTELDDKNQQAASTPAHTAEFHFAAGHWQRTPVKTQAQYPTCLGADGKSVGAGAETEQVAWSLEPELDGPSGALSPTQC